MLAIADFSNPMFWAVMIGWIMSVVLHEYAHGLVAYWGGDYTIRERGGLTLNPLQYVDPLMSLILPAVYLLMGGVPLPGGSTFVRRDLLRGRGWSAAVSLAGPAMNTLLFFACALPLHPALGWANYDRYPAGLTNMQTFLAAMALLQFIAVILNLVPVPPLDGFQALSPFLDAPTRQKLSTPPVSTFLFVGYFLVLWYVPAVVQAIFRLFNHLFLAMGFGDYAVMAFGQAFNQALYGG
jgi:Zn-dependent protease